MNLSASEPRSSSGNPRLEVWTLGAGSLISNWDLHEQPVGQDRLKEIVEDIGTQVEHLLPHGQLTFQVLTRDALEDVRSHVPPLFERG